MDKHQTKNKLFLYSFFCAVLLLVLCANFCACKSKKAEAPKTPQNLTTNEDGPVPEPVLKVYNTASKKIEEIPLETYVLGVVAAEMPNNFPSEALKAQAILARTFALDFVKNNKSKYEGADISTDISEAQAYDPEKINDAIIEAVAETQGKVLAKNGEYVKTWFHSNSGGKTATAEEAFGQAQNNDTKIVESPENEKNSENATWELYLSRAEILSSLLKMGKSVKSVSNIQVEETGESGRAINIAFGDEKISATEFRNAVGSTKFKSTLLSEILVDKYGATFKGKGYGHGVGMSQWGAKVLAEKGKTAEDILQHYYQDVDIVNIY